MQLCWAGKTEFIIIHLLWKVTSYEIHRHWTPRMHWCCLVLRSVAVFALLFLWGSSRQRLIFIPCYRGFLKPSKNIRGLNQTGSNTLPGYDLIFVSYHYHQPPAYIIKSINIAGIAGSNTLMRTTLLLVIPASLMWQFALFSSHCCLWNTFLVLTAGNTW